MKSSSEWNSLNDYQRQIILRHHTAFPVAVGAIAKDFGISVLKSTMPGSISGEIREIDGKVIIKVNRHDIKARQRFTLAHEIAHFLLHRDRLANGITDDVLYRSGLTDDLERQANRLAADIILPHSLIQLALASLNCNKADEKLKSIADLAQVSLAAVKIRLGK